MKMRDYQAHLIRGTGFSCPPSISIARAENLLAGARARRVGKTFGESKILICRQNFLLLAIHDFEMHG
jgi:hypothetical protein